MDLEAKTAEGLTFLLRLAAISAKAWSLYSEVYSSLTSRENLSFWLRLQSTTHLLLGVLLLTKVEVGFEGKGSETRVTSLLLLKYSLLISLIFSTILGRWMEVLFAFLYGPAVSST
jgi:hypothetical protein